MADEKKTLDPASRKVLDEAMAAFTGGVEKHRKGVEDGTIDTLHDVLAVDPSKADDHLTDAASSDESSAGGATTAGPKRETFAFPSMSTIEHRVSDAVEIGGGEGFGLSTAKFDGKLAIVVDQGTMAHFIDEGDEDLLEILVQVILFDSEAERTTYLDELKFYRFPPK